MNRYFCHVAYHGARYHGWQKQKNAHTLQAVLEEALSNMLRADIEITGSGRTDKGVHAFEQVFHFDCSGNIDCEKILFRLNAYLPVDISANKLYKVNKNAHARFDAKKRSYIYRINRVKSPFEQGLSYYFHRPLLVERMNEASDLLIGQHDFESFSKVHTDVNNFVCEIFTSQWQLNNELLTYHVTANRFLRGMVRTIVGTLLLVGEDKINLKSFEEIIESKDRRSAGRAVPAQGLYLSEVQYPESIINL